MSNEKLMIENLKMEAAKDKALDAVLHGFAVRKRARSIVTVYALRQKMKEEGFTFTAEQYEKVLSTLASHHVGILVRNSKGRIIALKDIRISLQSLGQAVYGANVKVTRFRKRNRFAKLTTTPVQSVEAPKALTRAPKAPEQAPSKSGIVLTVLVSGKAVHMEIPADFDSNDVGSLVAKFIEQRSA